MSKSPSHNQSSATKQSNNTNNSVKPLTETEISNQIDKEMVEDFVDDLN